jgi:hypothetical protein
MYGHQASCVLPTTDPNAEDVCKYKGPAHESMKVLCSLLQYINCAVLNKIQDGL